MVNIRWTQLLATISVCFGALCTGIIIGWSGGLDDDKLRAGELNDVKMSTEYLGPIMCIGCMLVCIPTGVSVHYIGRKVTCLLTIIPFTLGWLLMIFTKHDSMAYIGRFCLGLGGGAFCVAAPLYTSEIAETQVRGMLCSFFQLFITIGILYAWVLGAYLKLKHFMYACAVIPFVFVLLMVFQPESPVYLIQKGKDEKAIKAFTWLRKKDYDTNADVKDAKEQIEKQKAMQGKFKEAMSTKAAKKACLIVFMLMFYQQFSGINIVMFYAGSKIFGKKNGSNLSVQTGLIIVGVLQVVCCVIVAGTIDLLGRKVYLQISAGLMTLSLLAMAIFFTIKDYKLASEKSIEKAGALSVIACSLYIVGFSVGYGPIPWMAAAEVMPNEIKSKMMALSGAANWLMAFVVPMMFTEIEKKIYGPVYFIFVFIMITSMIFVALVVPETKGKTFDQIQQEIG